MLSIQWSVELAWALLCCILWIFVSQWDLFSIKLPIHKGGVRDKEPPPPPHFPFAGLTSLKWIGAQRDFSLSTSPYQSMQWIQGHVWKWQLCGACRAAEWELWKETPPGETHKCPISSWIQTGLFKVIHRRWTSDLQFDSFSLEVQTLKDFAFSALLFCLNFPRHLHSNFTQYPIHWAVRLASVSGASGCQGEHVFLGDYCPPFWLTSPLNSIESPFF